MSPGPGPDTPVTRADIEAKLAQIKGVADDTTEVAEGAAKTGLVVAGIGVVLVAFLLGQSAWAQEEHHRRSAGSDRWPAKSDAFIAVGAAASAAQVIRKRLHLAHRGAGRFHPRSARVHAHSGNRAWFYVAAGATGLRLLHTYTGRTEDILTMKLKPGERLEIREIRRTK